MLAGALFLAVLVTALVPEVTEPPSPSAQDVGASSAMSARAVAPAPERTGQRSTASVGLGTSALQPAPTATQPAVPTVAVPPSQKRWMKIAF